MVRIVVALIVLMLAGCAARDPAPIYDRNAERLQRAPTSGTRIRQPPRTTLRHSVRKGDTLYSIAWRYGLDFRTLAQWNGIGAPYTIYPGQELELRKPRSPRTSSTSTRTPPRTAPSVAASTPARSEPSPLRSTTPSTPPVATSAAPRPAAETGRTTSPPPPASTSPTRWNWPAEGRIVTSFSAETKGIDIEGQKGQKVLAAADGEVVYSGTGLIGYGELVIIKHDDRYLSAYGHNARRHVAEGGQVKAGQHIADMGQDSRSRTVLHFEIRDRGKPVNPVGILPRR